MTTMVKPLEWCEPREGTEAIRYDHVIAETAIGRILITWKSWKDYPSYDIEEIPWGDGAGFYGYSSLEEAKEVAFEELQKMVFSLIEDGENIE